MKSAKAGKNLPTPSSETYPVGTLDDDALFFNHVFKHLGQTRQEFAYDMQWNKSHVDHMLSGLKPDPVSRVRDMCNKAKQRGRGFVVASILLRIAGHDFTDNELNDQAAIVGHFAKLVMSNKKDNQ
jgi:hypothetical protein